jgi:UDP-galactopyranose mutase
METIVVFSHLRWDFVYQRPQHLLSRLARRRRIVIIEEPIFDEAPGWEKHAPAPNVLVIRPRTSIREEGFTEAQIAELARSLPGLMAAEGVAEPIAWLYTPLALPLARLLEPRLLIYDCMDELSMFLNAPAELLPREADLLQAADLVFTGGPSLYQAKLGRNPNVYCFPSSVEADHFRQARAEAGRLAAVSEPPDQAALPRPRLGFYGVIDERLDLPLLEALASQQPDWQIVLVGPVVKIDPASLPRRPNLHYLGQRGYADLPAYLAGWDVCLLPFARNNATRFISPTKTLEYMAAERAIVSTPIADVAGPYGDIVYLGDTPQAFLNACRRALAASESERRQRAAAMRQVIARTSWDATAESMAGLIDQALDARAPRPEPAPAWAAEARSRARQPRTVTDEQVGLTTVSTKRL